jgi:hypothetical protein
MMKRRSIFFAFAFFAFALFAFALTATAAALAAATPAGQSPATAKVTFRGTEYFLRSSHGNEYDFTPPGQEDLYTFTDMLSLDLYPAAMTKKLWPQSPVGSARLPRARKPPSCERFRFPLQGNKRASISLPLCGQPPMVWISMRNASSSSTNKVSGCFIPTGPTASQPPARRVNG